MMNLQCKVRDTAAALPLLLKLSIQYIVLKGCPNMNVICLLLS